MIYEEGNYRFINPMQVARVSFNSCFDVSDYELSASLTMVSGIEDFSINLAKTPSIKEVEDLFVEKALSLLNSISPYVDKSVVRKDIKHGLEQIATYRNNC
jgi:hypothetical protein